ncbi:response regulator transcription factor [Dactylosporangium vinaceum]|uniref:Response regulator n=1 Tax=Dactylosporangium vinaceum TaxID=53362 RepID=A0ABV5M1Y4_9ACTN|nr:response regulator transcription factor [Dactylosporangium vinaceum]UAB99349.1 response regulator transcription factor [Dactylosporangium vinaceum]
MITVLVVDDNPIVRTALRTYLDAAAGVSVVAEAADGLEALAEARRTAPAVTLLDHRMPRADGLTVLPELARLTAILVLTSDPDPTLITQMLRGGARGYLVHGTFTPDDLHRAVQAVAAGQGWLSPAAAAVATATMRARPYPRPRPRHGLTRREQDVLDLLAEGLTNAAIAHRLLLTEKTVKNHLHRAYAKLRVTNRTEALLRWTGRT